MEITVQRWVRVSSYRGYGLRLSELKVGARGQEGVQSINQELLVVS